ncbi:MAG: RagB/SusD family nutrient uptake outer membrane protein [Cytophagales bacterium]|nr:MAG: RagB/SusD family nutrient uptake outer membrane protein [Cytophagales bacterium]
MKKLIIASIVFLLTTGCANYIYLDPKNDILAENFYKTEQDAFSAIMACYSNIQHVAYYGSSYFQVVEMASDDITTKNLTDAIDDFNWSATQDAGGEPQFRDLWRFMYEGVYRTNLVLENVSKTRRDKKSEIPFKSEVDRNAILGEAYFLRGLHYFNLAVLFGGAPILTETPQSASFPGPLYVKRSTRQEVFNQAVEDLKMATNLLPPTWSDINQGRITLHAANALLGKIYLHKACYIAATRESDFQSAKDYLFKVIDSKKFSLLTGPTAWKDIFEKEYHSESIFEITYSKYGNFGWTHDVGIASENQQRDLRFGVQGGISQGYGELIATQEWANSCEMGDPRIRQSLRFLYDNDFSGVGDDKTTKVTGKSYEAGMARDVKENRSNTIGEFFHVKKGVDNFGASGPGGAFGEMNYKMIRYSDVLLMYAEACLETGELTKATEYLNKVRERARGLSSQYLTIKRRLVMDDVPTPIVTFGGFIYDGQNIPNHLPKRPNASDATVMYAGFPNTVELDIPNNLVVGESSLKILSEFPYATLTENNEPLNYGVTNAESAFLNPELGLFPIRMFEDKKYGLRDAIVRERRVELAFEYHRFLDLRRWEALDEKDHPGSASIVFSLKNEPDNKKKYLNTIHNLCPIPQNQIDLSRETLTQNPGY